MTDSTIKPSLRTWRRLRILAERCEMLLTKADEYERSERPMAAHAARMSAEHCSDVAFLHAKLEAYWAETGQCAP